MSNELAATRIAFCITDLDPGGAERALVQLVTRLDRRRWQPRVYALSEPGELVAVLRQAAIPVECLGARHAGHLSALWRLVGELRRFRPAILQTYLFHANIAGRVAGKLAGVRRIVSGIRVAEQRTRTHLWLDRMTNSLVDTNVCVSEAVAEFSRREAKLKSRKIVVIPNGVDVNRFGVPAAADLTALGIPPGSPVLLAIGRLDPQKGIQYLVEAVSDPGLRGLNFHLLLVGEGPERPGLAAAIRSRGLDDKVHLAGWRDDIPELLRAATALVLPSLWEGMPNVVLEAMAVGLPVIASRVEGTTELIVEGETGLLVAPRAPREIAGAIGTLLTCPELGTKLGLAGQSRVRTHFSWEKTVRCYEELYLSLLASDVQHTQPARTDGRPAEP